MPGLPLPMQDVRSHSSSVTTTDQPNTILSTQGPLNLATGTQSSIRRGHSRILARSLTQSIKLNIEAAASMLLPSDPTNSSSNEQKFSGNAPSQRPRPASMIISTGSGENGKAGAFHRPASPLRSPSILLNPLPLPFPAYQAVMQSQSPLSSATPSQIGPRPSPGKGRIRFAALPDPSHPDFEFGSSPTLKTDEFHLDTLDPSIDEDAKERVILPLTSTGGATFARPVIARADSSNSTFSTSVSDLSDGDNMVFSSEMPPFRVAIASAEADIAPQDPYPFKKKSSSKWVSKIFKSMSLGFVMRETPGETGSELPDSSSGSTASSSSSFNSVKPSPENSASKLPPHSKLTQRRQSDPSTRSIGSSEFRKDPPVTRVMLNGYVYGHRRAASALALQTQSRHTEAPAFVEWGPVTLNRRPRSKSIQAESTSALGLNLAAPAAVEPDDLEDDGSGLAWVRRRREARRQAQSQGEEASIVN